jgi:nitrogen fixation/metabolism regulation signal transduction histidine kinase
MVIPEALSGGLEDLGWSQLQILTAESGEAALEVAKEGPLDLLVADVIMPGIDGIETFSRLKERYPHLACVVMTAHAPEHITPIRALRLGAADYVTKPVDPEYLVKTCHRQLIVSHLRRSVEENRRLMQAIVNSVGDGVVACSDREILVINEAAQQMLGQSVEQVLTRLAELGFQASQGEDEPKELGVIRREHADGTRLLSLMQSPVRDKSGRQLGDVVVLRDITDAMESRSIESFKEMAAIASHEMKNSVTGLGLVTQHLVARLQDGNLEPEENQRMARIILDSVARLNRFAKSFLNFSRIPDPKTHECCPNALVEEAVSLYSHQGGLPQWCEISTNLGQSMPAVMADRDLMFQVLQNLVLNSVEAMEGQESGRIVVATSTQDGQVCISVSDTGKGIAEDMLERIFEPNVTTRQAGTGLGLVIVRDIVHKHGGRISVESKLGQGSTFTVSLPATSSSSSS